MIVLCLLLFACVILCVWCGVYSAKVSFEAQQGSTVLSQKHHNIKLIYIYTHIKHVFIDCFFMMILLGSNGR